jgi:hypothetical protein
VGKVSRPLDTKMSRGGKKEVIKCWASEHKIAKPVSVIALYRISAEFLGF